MPTYDYNHWLARAREARELAVHLANPAARRAMLEIAEHYEKIAKRAEAREVGIAIHDHWMIDSGKMN